MAYTKTTWEDLPSENTIIDADKLNNMEDGIEANDTALGTKLAKATNVTAITDTGIADGEIAVFNLTNKDIRTSNINIEGNLPSKSWTLDKYTALRDRKSVV